MKRRPPPAPAPLPEPPPPGRRRLIAFGLGVVCFLVYLSSLKPPDAADSLPTRLLPFSILREGNLDLNEFSWLTRLQKEPYFLRHTQSGRVVSRYPFATGLVATPFAVPAVWWLERNGIDDDDVRFRLAALVVERIAASAIAAVSTALVFLVLCRLTSPGIAVGIALVYGIGTNTWATSSQALWQHGLAELCLAALSLAFIGRDSRRGAIAASAFAALGVLVRPTMAIFAALALLYVWRERRHHLLAFLALPAIGAAVMLVYNVGTLGSALGGYAGVAVGSNSFGASLLGMAGLLISPSRGLLIFTPAVVLSLVGLARWRRPRPSWVLYLGAGFGLYLLLYGSFRGWYGGATYGPRFLVDILPALAFASVPAVEALAGGMPGRIALAVLAVYGVAVQALGAHGDTHYWNSRPRSVNQSRVWQWSDPQILRTARRPWRGGTLAPLLRQAATQPTAALLREMSPESLRGEIVVESPLPLVLRAGETAPFAVRLTNLSDIAWPAFSDYGHLECRVVYIWEPEPPGFAGAAGSLSLGRSLPPGESARLAGRLEAPPQRGAFNLRVFLVQLLEPGGGVFGQTAVDVPVTVE